MQSINITTFIRSRSFLQPTTCFLHSNFHQSLQRNTRFSIRKCGIFTNAIHTGVTKITHYRKCANAEHIKIMSKCGFTAFELLNSNANTMCKCVISKMSKCEHTKIMGKCVISKMSKCEHTKIMGKCVISKMCKCEHTKIMGKCVISKMRKCEHTKNNRQMRNQQNGQMRTHYRKCANA